MEKLVMEKIGYHKVNKAKITRPHGRDKRCIESGDTIRAAKGTD